MSNNNEFRLSYGQVRALAKDYPYIDQNHDFIKNDQAYTKDSTIFFDKNKYKEVQDKIAQHEKDINNKNSKVGQLIENINNDNTLSPTQKTYAKNLFTKPENYKSVYGAGNDYNIDFINKTLKELDSSRVYLELQFEVDIAKPTAFVTNIFYAIGLAQDGSDNNYGFPLAFFNEMKTFIIEQSKNSGSLSIPTTLGKEYTNGNIMFEKSQKLIHATEHTCKEREVKIDAATRKKASIIEKIKLHNDLTDELMYKLGNATCKSIESIDRNADIRKMKDSTKALEHTTQKTVGKES